VTFGVAMPAHSQNPQFDVLGLRTGMTADQVKTVITAKFGAAVFKPISIQKQKGVIPGHSFTSSIGIHTDKLSLIVNFVEVPPAMHRGAESAYHISYIPALMTDADKIAFKKQAIEKYGPPFDPVQVKENDVWQAFAWCTSNSALQRYTQCNPGLNGGTAVLTLQTQILGFGIELTEQSIYTQMQAALEAVHTTTQPPL
jgi:hypothetical protein